MTVEPLTFTYDVTDAANATGMEEKDVRRILRRLVVRPWHLRNTEYSWAPDEFRKICIRSQCGERSEAMMFTPGRISMALGMPEQRVTAILKRLKFDDKASFAMVLRHVRREARAMLLEEIADAQMVRMHRDRMRLRDEAKIMDEIRMEIANERRHQPGPRDEASGRRSA